MVEERPLISIGMASHNGEKTLSSAISSLLTQSYENWELVMIDDGSSDRTLEIVLGFKDARIQVHTDGERSGLPARLNQAVSLSRGEFFARMDADDIAYPQRLELQLDYLLAHPEVDLVGAQVLIFDDQGHASGKREFPEHHEAVAAKPWSGFRIAHPAFMGRLQWFRRFPYDEGLLKAQDQDLLLRACPTSRFANVPTILLGYRQDRITLKKLWVSRAYHTRALYRAFSEQAWKLVKALSLQAFKISIDTLAFALGLKQGLLRRRSTSVSELERLEWEGIWRHVHQESQVQPVQRDGQA